MDVEQLRRCALALPEVTEQPHFTSTSFRVRGKIFVTVPPEQEHAHVFVPEDGRAQALALYPDCMEKLYWGAKVLGLRIHLAVADADVVGALVTQAWRAKAPRTLLAECAS